MCHSVSMCECVESMCVCGFVHLQLKGSCGLRQPQLAGGVNFSLPQCRNRRAFIPSQKTRVQNIELQIEN